jgi:S1-C subfamily serine protease
LLLNTGTSGGPVLDCRQGRVIAMINAVLTIPSTDGAAERCARPTPVGMPTNTAVPAEAITRIADAAR